MKKLIALLFVFGFIVFSAPQVHASVLSDALLKIQNLQKEVEKLKTQIGAAVYSSRYNSYLGGTSSGTTPGSTSGTNTDCQSGEIFSYSTGQRCPIAPVVIPTPIISSITVLTPNGGEVYYLGDGNSFTKQIKLVSSKIGTHSIYLVENPSINNLGSKFFLSSTVGSVNPINGIDTSTTSLATGLINPGQYYVMSEWKSSDGLENHVDFSDNPFTIKAATPIAPVVIPTPIISSITVLTPNGGEVYQAGQQITVKWKSTGILASNNNIDIKIHGYDSKGVIVWSKDLSSSTLNDGQESVIIPTSFGGIITFGNNFVIAVGTDSMNNPSPVFDYSDNKFNIKQSITEDGCLNGDFYSSTTGARCSPIAPVVIPTPTTVASGCSGTVMYDPITGKLCPIGVPIIGTSDVKIYSPKGGSVFTQGLNNVISWTGGTSKVQIGVVSLDYTGENGALFGWIELNGKPNSATTWDGGTLKALDGSISSQVIPGKYKIVAVSKSEEGNYCSGSNSNTSGPKIICNYDLSGLITVKSASSVDTGCQAGAVYSYTTGSKCPVPTIPTVTDIGCSAGALYSNTTGQACPVDNNVTTTPITRTLKQGVIGDDVKTLQEFLGLKTDGVYGRGTAVKVKEWQRLNGLNPDGAFGSMSRETAGLK